MMLKFESGKKTYQYVLVNVVPGIVEFAHALLQSMHVLNRVLGAASIHHRQSVFAQAKGCFSDIRDVPLIGVSLKRAQVSLAPLQLNNPAGLRGYLLSNRSRSSAGVQCKRSGAGCLAYSGLERAGKLLSGNCDALSARDFLGRRRSRFLGGCRWCCR